MMTPVTVETKNGPACGMKNGNIYCWKGIPYALPPVGALRFRHAVPFGKWSGTLDATAFGPACPQKRKKLHTLDEDCLKLNIWAPEHGRDTKMPVLFYIHGGSFCKGAGSDPEYDGKNLAKKGMVGVTFNYRLGVLGFMDFSFLGERFQPNCGLSDIVAALTWVYENISSFGGDPSSITVGGQSAGGIAASVLATMPAAKRYISKVIIMSGGPNWLNTPAQSHDIARGYMEFAGIKSAGRLMETPARRLASLQKSYSRCNGYGENTFAIQVDGGLVPEFPIPAADRGAAEGIPILIGTTAEEVAFARMKPLERILNLKDMILAMISNEARNSCAHARDIRQIRQKRPRDAYGRQRFPPVQPLVRAGLRKIFQHMDVQVRLRHPRNAAAPAARFPLVRYTLCFRQYVCRQLQMDVLAFWEQPQNKKGGTRGAARLCLLHKVWQGGLAKMRPAKHQRKML
jgi:para-nitrobenzyl esterase